MIKNETIDLAVAKGVTLELDVELFSKQVDEKLGRESLNEAKKYSLTNCAMVCDVGMPQLHYYVVQKIVKPIGKVERGCTKYFNREALLAFFIITSLKKTIRINISCLKSLQKQIRQAMS